MLEDFCVAVYDLCLAYHCSSMGETTESVPDNTFVWHILGNSWTMGRFIIYMATYMRNLYKLLQRPVIDYGALSPLLQGLSTYIAPRICLSIQC